MTDGVKIPIEAKLDPADVTAAIQQLAQQINRLGPMIAAANKVKFNPIDKASVEDLKRVEQGFARLTKVSEDFRRRIKSTGQTGAGFFDLDWKQLYPDAGSRARKQRSAFEYVTGREFSPAEAAAHPPAPPLPRAPVPKLPPLPKLPSIKLPPTPGSLMGGILHRGLSSGLHAAGPVGGAINSGISGGMSGGLAAGLAGLVGGLLAFGTSSIVSGVKDKVGAAQDENIGYDTLKRQIGDVGVSFNALKESIRAASYSFDGTFEETQNLAREFATLGNVSRDSYRTIAEQVAIGGGFGRAYGMDPAAANRFFGMERGLGQTSTVDDTRRLAITMGETIAKSGAFAKAEEVLNAAAAFSAGQTRSGLTTTNLSAYGGALAGLTSSGIPGLDVTGAAGLLSRLNSGIANGGNKGEAGQAFIYNAIGKPLGLDPVQAQLLREQGIFGTGASTFGKGSVAAQFYGPNANFGSAAGSNTTNIDAIMKSLRAQYGSNPSMLASALSGLTGLNISQSMAFASTPSAQLGQLSGLLQKNGVDIKDISATGIGNLASIATGDRATLLNHAKSLEAMTGHNALTADERRDLESTLSGGDPDKLRDILIKLSADRDQEETEGGKTRLSINNLNKTLQAAADKLIPPINDMRNAMVYLAGGTSHMTARQINEAVRDGEIKDVSTQADDQKDAINKQYADKIGALRADLVGKRVRANPTDPMAANVTRYDTPEMTAEAQQMEDLERQRLADRAAVDAQRDAQIAVVRQRYTPSPSAGGSTAGGGAGGASGITDNSPPLAETDIERRMLPGLAETDRLLGFPVGTSASQMFHEHGFRQQSLADAHDNGVYGIGQFQAPTLASISKELGRNLDNNNPEDTVVAHRQYMREGLAAAAKAGLDGTAAMEYALKYYNGGPNTRGWGPRGVKYVADTERDAPRYGAQIARDVAARQAAAPPLSGGSIKIDGTFVLMGPNGVPMAAPANITKIVGMPQPSGSR